MSLPSSATASSPHPVLQAALGSLDVQLEVELAQYRCHQIVRRFPPPLAYRASQDQISKPLNGTPLLPTELGTTIHSSKHTHLHLNNSVTNTVSNSKTSPLTSPNNLQASSLPEPADSPLTLEAYLEFSQSCWRNSQASTKSKFLQRLWSPLAIAVAVSLLLSIPIGMIILHLTSFVKVGSETCLVVQTPRLLYFCRGSPALGDR